MSEVTRCGLRCGAASERCRNGILLKADPDMYHLPDPITVSVLSTRIMIAYYHDTRSRYAVMIRPVPCRVGFCSIIKGELKLNWATWQFDNYCEDTDTEQIGGVHNLIQGLIQYADTDTVIGSGKWSCLDPPLGKICNFIALYYRDLG
jgi:hypothetical protein